jgi:hypothetical protein
VTTVDSDAPGNAKIWPGPVIEPTTTPDAAKTKAAATQTERRTKLENIKHP